VLRFVLHRILVMIPTLIAISVVTFVIIQLPPGDYLTAMMTEMRSQGEGAAAKVEYLRELYGLDRPMWQQYLYWVGGLLQGDLGYSFEYERPVSEVVGDRVFLTFLISFATVLFTWVVSFPIAIYSATHKYSWGDHGLTFLGFLGLATPSFLLALVLLYFANVTSASRWAASSTRSTSTSRWAGASSSPCSSTCGSRCSSSAPRAPPP
jgi:peptide/nickel transport system permease protein